MTNSRTIPAKHRDTFRAAEPRSIDWRIVAPATRRVLDRLGAAGSGTIWSGRALFLTAICSSAGTALFVLGGVVLLARR